MTETTPTTRTTSRARRSLAFVLPPLVLGLAGVIFFGLKATKPELAPREVQERVWTVATMPAERGEHRGTVQAYGTVQAARTIELKAGVEGEVLSVTPAFSAGTLVRAGDVLVEIDPLDYRTGLVEERAIRAELAADLASTRAERSEAARQRGLRADEVQRRETLARRGNISRTSLDDSRVLLSQISSTLAVRDAQIKRLEASIERQDATIERAERDLAETTVTAPFDGWLADISVELGARVRGGDRLARVIASTGMEVRFFLGLGAYARLAAEGDIIGAPLTVTWRAGDRRIAMDGTVVRVAGEVDATAGGVDVYALLDPADVPAALRPGTFVSVSIEERTVSDAVRLPATALHDGTIYRVADGALVAEKASLAVRLGNDVVVVTDAPDGAPVVVTDIPGIRAGMRVRTP